MSLLQLETEWGEGLCSAHHLLGLGEFLELKSHGKIHLNILHFL